MSIGTKIRKFIKWAFKACFALILAVCLLSAAVLIYDFAAAHTDNKDGSTDYRLAENSFFSTMKEGVAFLKSDENGYNNAFPPKKDSVDILLMGSSHMEALNIASDENVGYLLNELLPEYYTYNIGVSGHTIYRCVHNFKDAVKTYNPASFVIIETDSVALDIEKMNEAVSDEYKKLKSYDSGILYYVQKFIPAVKGLYNAVDEWRNADNKTGRSAVTVGQTLQNPYYLSDEYTEALDRFISELKTENDNLTVIIVYQPTTAVDKSGSFFDSTDLNALESFLNACDKNGIVFVDMTDDFKELYYSRNILAHGFSNTAVGVGHLNKYGHGVIAEKLADTIIGEAE